VVQDFNDRAFDLLPLEVDPAAPGPSSLGENYCSGDFIDERVEEDPFPTAGRVICMDHTLHEKWRLLFGHEDFDGNTNMEDGALLGQEFAPFPSELDWRVARWAIQEGIGHKSLDQLLAIPGVSAVYFYATLPDHVSL
jgi:hypothetical protein